MNKNVKIAEKMIRLAKSMVADNQKVDDFNAFKKHIVDACNEQAQKLQELYTWCQMNYNAFTQGIEPFEKIVEIKTQLEEFAKSIQDSKQL